MKVISIIIGCYWIGIGIAAFCGVEWSSITVGCACACAALGSFSNVFRS